MASIFAYRKGYRAQAIDKSGKRQTKYFEKHAIAKAWGAEIESQEASAQLPEIGGPTTVNLAQSLQHYAGLYSVGKGGVSQELTRINAYLVAAGMPSLRLKKAEDGTAKLVTVSAKEVDDSTIKGFQTDLARRRAKSALTSACRARLATKRMSLISKTDIDGLVAQMKLDGLSASTVQKEVALLKVVFNTAIARWNWVNFRNPCIGIKLGGSQMRFVRVTIEQLKRLSVALSECDNPWFWPLVDAAIYLTARKKSLLTLEWRDIDFETRHATLRDSKTGTVLVPLAPRVVKVLQDLPHHESGRVFPMTSNAVTLAWDGVRKKAGLKNLQFRDLRHVGGTHYAKLVGDANILRQILGHKTTYMAQIYVNMTETDVAQHIEHCERTRDVEPRPPEPSVQPANPPRVSHKAQRMIDGMHRRLGEQRLAVLKDGTASGGAVVIQFPRLPEPPVEGEKPAAAA